ALEVASFAAHEQLLFPDQSVADILATLRDKSTRADVLYLDAQLVYRECPDPSLYGGLQLLKHIRLSPSLERLSLLPVVVGAVDPPGWLIRQSVDNVIIFSPGCEAVKLPTLISNFDEAFGRLQSFSDHDQMRDVMRPFVWMTERDKQLWEHAYRNRAGVGKFLKEFAGLAEHDAGYLHYEGKWQGEVWFKKVQFLQGQQDARIGSDIAQLRKHMHGQARNCRFIYIDDEHWLGWSYGLYMGLVGGSVRPECFDKGRELSLIETPDGRLMCFAKPEEVESFFKNEAENLNNAFQEWATCAKKGQDMLKAISSHPPCDLVFLDLRLTPHDQHRDRPAENLTGIQLLRRIKSAFLDLPVIIVSASKDVRSLREAERWGADGYWIKDLSTGEELMQTVIRCLEKAKLRPIWRAIRMVEEKEEIVAYKWSTADGTLQKRTLSKAEPTVQSGTYQSLAHFTDAHRELWEGWLDRQLIAQWLRESFRLLWDEKGIRNLGFHDEDYPYDRVILDMGLIQELRLKGLAERGESRWTGVPFKECESKLRNRRNDMVHPERTGCGSKPSPATREEAITFLKFSLNRLLDQELFSEERAEAPWFTPRRSAGL
ncbi:MAG: response regulator, partial [candidate division WOR-3 bacterium]